MTKPEGWEVDYLSRVRLRIVNLGKMDNEALNHIENLLKEMDPERYRELLSEVATKHPGETRHQTALRYIQQAERHDNDPESAKERT